MSQLLSRLQSALPDRYSLKRELGRGGMAIVYLAEDRRNERFVAIKVLRPELTSAVVAERFLREIKLTAKLTHPHILPLLDSGKADGFLYYVMPYMEGESLREKLNRDRRLPIDEAVTIAREVADALSYAHERGLVHRDIKPENILLESGHAVVADFGIARALNEAGGERLTETGVSIGTPAYMSPEQATGERELDESSDLYSLGCVLYEMLAGEPPIVDSSVQRVVSRKLLGEYQPLGATRRNLPPELDAAVSRTLAIAPSKRLSSAREFSEVLAPTIRLEGDGRPKRRWPLWAPATRWLAVLAVAVFVGVGSYFYFQRLTAEGPRGDDRLGVAVFPFRPSGDLVEGWSEGLADLLSTVLDGTHGIRVADPWSLWQSLRPQRAGWARSPDPAEASHLARQAGAKRFVIGSLVGTGNVFDISLRLYSVDAEQPLHTITESGTADELGSVAQRLALGLIPRLVGSEEAPSIPPLDRYTTDSAEALKAYLAAKAAMRRGLVDSANVAIDRALAVDSTFALALVEAAAIKSWVQFMRGEFFSNLVGLAERAVQHAEELGERDRLRAEAMLASVRTDGPTLAETTRRIIEIDSTDFQAWNQRAYSHLVYGWQYGADPRDALEASERVVQLDSLHVPGLVRRAWLAVALENTRDIRVQMDRLEAADTTGALIKGSLWGLRAVLASDTAFSRMSVAIAEMPLRQWLGVLRYLRQVQPGRAESLLKRLKATAEPGRATYAVLGEKARLLLAEGRVAELDSAIAAGEYRAGELWKHLHRFQIAASLSGVGEESATRRSVEWLNDDVPVDSALVLFETRPVWWSGWLLGAHHATEEDTAITRRWQEAIGQLPAGGTSLDYRGALQSDLEARLAVRRGDYDAALESARRAFRLWSIHTENDFEASASPQIRFNLALLYRAAGLSDSAEALLQSLVPPTAYMGFLTARSSFELGQLAENREDLDSALRHYRRAFRYWSRGGPEVAEWRDRAESALRGVVAERGS